MKSKSYYIFVASMVTLFIVGSNPAASATPLAKKCVVVMNMVGKNYQKAQDVWRAQTLIVLPAKDATGQNRLPWLDSNWYVVAQKPKAGKCVKRNSSIRASVKKYTDR